MTRGVRALVAYNGADAGLGNRIRVTLGCQVLSEFEERRFFCVWPTGPLFEPRPNELWNLDGVRIVPRAVSRVIAKVFPYQEADATGSEGAAGGPLVRQIRTGAEIRLPDGCASWKERFRRLTPVSEIQARVEQIHRDHLAGTPYVGVQVRAHAVSHAVTKQTSPVEWYIDRMSQIRSEDPNTVFYLSCDVPEVFDRISASVGGCVGIRDKGAYNSTAAVRGAIVDLYALAGAGHLVAPYGSSFVLLAHYLADEKVPIETPKSPHPVEVRPSSCGVVLDPLSPAGRDTRS